MDKQQAKETAKNPNVWKPVLLIGGAIILIFITPVFVKGLVFAGLLGYIVSIILKKHVPVAYDFLETVVKKGIATFWNMVTRKKPTEQETVMETVEEVIVEPKIDPIKKDSEGDNIPS